MEDAESILDECRAASLPQLHLRWHYRSRNEGLIAFSNHHYYDNSLLTFPSPHLEQGVSFRHVPGVYDKSKSRTNRIEAEALVGEMVRRLLDPVLSAVSIGVVTFSQAQRDLIADLLEVERRNHSEIERFFDPENPDRVFIKNLENVQGDERDAIFFSVGYGPDAAGKVSMSFGPLNRDGGERRLNVAVTRARKEVVLFSSLKPEQIDLARTRARGVQDLKCYMEYAERGMAAIREAIVRDPSADFDSPFEQQVCEALRAKGHTVHAQVGCSGYRVDLAVVDPECPGRYLLGIECDGANYHRSRNARDRDRLREMVLRGLGWEIARIWSTDWWQGEGIITLSDPLASDQLPTEYVEQYKRQLYFLLDILRSPQKVHEVQKRIFDAQIAVFGLGAVGCGILQQLCMMGFRRFVLIDYAEVEANDIARTPFRTASQIGLPKTLAAKALVEDLAFEPVVRLHNTTLQTRTDLDKLVQGTTLMVNTADEPYVGYTNIKLSRYALQHDIPLMAAGGFDAHLASLGELLVPHVTPCADCYATYFHESLKDWKPVPHPVKEREGWFGGLGSLSAFSASTAALDILAYFMNPEDKRVVAGGRGEFHFHDYSLDTFTVERDARCQSCGEGRA